MQYHLIIAKLQQNFIKSSYKILKWFMLFFYGWLGIVVLYRLALLCKTVCRHSTNICVYVRTTEWQVSTNCQIFLIKSVLYDKVNSWECTGDIWQFCIVWRTVDSTIIIGIRPVLFFASIIHDIIWKKIFKYVYPLSRTRSFS
jgi:hypothetical protein